MAAIKGNGVSGVTWLLLSQLLLCPFATPVVPETISISLSTATQLEYQHFGTAEK